MPSLCLNDQCTSCLACFNACPFGAISITENSLSVKVPTVDNELCRNCGLCENSCPILNVTTFNEPQKAIALYSKKDYDKRTCASGGAATVFSREIIIRGGVVYGATSHGGYPKYIRVSTENELELLKGSKYVYCDPGKVYVKIREDLLAGKICLFIGTPCNVAGLYSFLRKDYKTLFTVDLICHGTPPYAYLKKHLMSKSVNLDEIKSISFRGSIDFHTTVFNHDGKIIYKRNQYEDEYFSAFMKGVMFRPSCYKCPYARKERVSDITIGDFWGISKGALNNYMGKISLAMINTDKGGILFDMSKLSFVWEQRSVEEAVLGNIQLQKPSRWIKEAQIFHDCYIEASSIQKAFKQSGILGLVFKNKLRRISLIIPKLIRNLIR